MSKRKNNKRKMKRPDVSYKIKIFKILPLFLVTIVALVVIFAFKMKIGIDYRDYSQINIHFEQSTEFEEVKAKLLNKGYKIEQIEKHDDANFSIILLSDLSSDQKQEIENELKSIAHFLSVEFIHVNKVIPLISYKFVAITVIILLIIFYVATNNIKYSNQRFLVLSTFVIITFGEIIAIYSSLRIISQFVPISRTFVEVAISLVNLIVFVNIFILWKLNIYIKNYSKKKDIIQKLLEFDEHYDQNFVFWYALTLLLFIPIITSLSNNKYLVLLIYLPLVYQMYLISIGWSELLKLWIIIFQKTPVIKKLKWSQIK